MPSLKYAVVERERRFLVRSLPGGVSRVSTIVDRYVGDGPAEVACTSLYLDDAEWHLLTQLPARTLRKRRHHIERDGLHVVVDEFEDGTLVAEVDDGAGPSTAVPGWLDVAADVSADESWTGASVAADGPPLARTAGH